MNETKKLRVALFFGGVSSEHEVSCVSASTWLRALAQAPCADRYEVFPVGITKQGRWLACSPTPEAMADGSWEKGVDCTPCVLSPDRTDHGIWLLKDGKAELVHIDICAPVMHGKNGEDGTIQGLFELARIPYVGCGVLGSAVCMDKAVANTIMDAAGVPHCKWASAIRAELEGDHKTLLDSIEQRLGYPIFVKPANAGSSVGITKATDRAVLEQAVVTALKEDDKVVFEEFIDGQEVECAAIGIRKIDAAEQAIVFTFAQKTMFDPAVMFALLQKRRDLRVLPGTFTRLKMTINSENAVTRLQNVRTIVNALLDSLPPEKRP